MKYILKYCTLVNPSELSFDTLERAQEAERYIKALTDDMLTRIVTLEDDEVKEVPLEAEPPEEHHVRWWEKLFGRKGRKW